MAVSKRIVQRLKVLWRVSGEAGSKPRLKQLLEMIWLVGTCEFSPGEYWTYGFHRVEQTKEKIRQYLPSRVYFSKVLPLLNNPKAHVFLENKWFFYLHFAKHSVETVKCFGLFHPISGYGDAGQKLTDGAGIEDLVERHGLKMFIAKPVAGTCGRDVFKVEVVRGSASLKFSLHDQVMDSKALVRYLSDRLYTSNSCGFLIQEYVQQHHLLQTLSPSACMNFRVVTVKDAVGGIHVTSASTRVGRAGSVVSNAGSGGMVAKVNPESGLITRCRSSGYIDSLEVEVHPDTGVRIVGSTLPFWREAVELSKKAADLLPGISSVGWDVLIRDNGPVLLEGNHDWDVIGEQLFGVGYLTDDNRNLLEKHGLDFGYVENPRFRIGKLVQFIN